MYQKRFTKWIALIITSILLQVAPLSSLSANFADVHSNSPFTLAVSNLFQRGIVRGYPDGLFHPEQSVSRIEFLKMVLLASNHQVNTHSTNTTFPDVPTDSWFAPYVQLALNNSYISGYADGTFKPDNKVSRVEGMKMLLNVYHIQLPGLSNLEAVSDISSTDWYAPYVSYSLQNELLDRCNSTNICPNQQLTRGEVAKMIYELERKLGRIDNATIGNHSNSNLEALSMSSSTARSSVIILVDPQLDSSALSQSFRTWISDLNNEGYNVKVKNNTWSNVEDIRTYLYEQYQQLTPRLEGVILVGNIPYARLWIHTCNAVDGCREQSAITYEFYQDLDGTFRKTNPAFPEVYSEHTGNLNHEIWTSQLPMFGDYVATQDAIVEYLSKNHQYRTNLQTNHSFIQIEHHQRATTLTDAQNIINRLMHGEYSIVPSNHRFVNQHYFFHNTSGFGTPADGYGALSSNSTYDFFELDDHADHNQIGLINSDWLSSNMLNAAFVLFTGCNTAQLDAPTSPIAVQSLYHINSKAVLLFGTTITSGGLGQTAEGYFSKAILKKLFEGKNVGSSFQYHLNLPLLSPWSNDYEFHHAPVFLGGDGTLKLKI